jgi:hypothetical protein
MFLLRNVILFIGVFMIALAAFGVQVPVINLFELGVGVAFASLFAPIGRVVA